MRTLLVVILLPAIQFRLCVHQIKKQMRVQAFVSKTPVEALNIGILDRLPKADEIQLDSMAIGP